MMSDDTSFFTIMSSSAIGMFGSKTILGCTEKLNGSSYLLWAQSFCIFTGAQNKLALLLEPSPAITDTTYETWLFSEYRVMTWLLNSLKEKISSSVMFLSTVKEMWDTLKVVYENKKNPSGVFEIYERLFELKQGDQSVPEFYRELKSLIDKLEMHQRAVSDAATLKRYRQDLTVYKFSSGLSPSMRSRVRGQILEGEYFLIDRYLL